MSQQKEDSGVLMFGMMGSGKSTVANTLLDRYEFEEGDGADTVTAAVQVAKVPKIGGGMLNVFDTPGLGDSCSTKIRDANNFINSLYLEIKKRGLKTIILVKKSTDFRVMSEFAWYQIYLKTIFDKEKFDMSKIIIAVTFAD